ncbi:glycerol acyltransferase [Salipiger aestuarii]|uniref:1-acyl-sn-glycerol-3-phosphate acyltransferase n=1 Tax=Salipiger aestuarii TaxID=568098 RepID=A0A327YNV1_9RHOB|nr:1-acyl-sn-glycerol-3-phosphate acyltransferase [Salipiger aestuarii]EIE48861.1 phospholipid/glycerol acyltransferase [Citreicella sp. 357]KAA8610383.1 glycerol acyltransferase [Salipiger aestuarii]KAA8616399.1 glycerol acyltransferase [Salipiger aestuarii]KAB2543506.1 glycerol acyltransferase [Salipiger aestuarii]RAK21927.1 1-acyl-sn-glycerol-3-phosphate acyltransferase [Salipiger aestuarii]
MAYAVQWVRSLAFTLVMYGGMAVIGLGLFPYTLMSRHGALRVAKLWCRFTLWAARWMIGLRTEVRGEVPTGEVLIASKHQSFLDIIVLFDAVPNGKFIMKRELLFTPVVGQYATRIGCVPVDRGKRGAAIAKMLREAAASNQTYPGQLIIFPQGTRVAPGVKADYKVGAALLHRQLKQPCIPAATNVGYFWPRTGVYRKSGLAVVEFLPVIPADVNKTEYLPMLEQVVETASERLLQEARDAAD